MSQILNNLEFKSVNMHSVDDGTSYETLYYF